MGENNRRYLSRDGINTRGYDIQTGKIFSNFDSHAEYDRNMHEYKTDNDTTKRKMFLSQELLPQGQSSGGNEKYKLRQRQANKNSPSSSPMLALPNTNTRIGEEKESHSNNTDYSRYDYNTSHLQRISYEEPQKVDKSTNFPEKGEEFNSLNQLTTTTEGQSSKYTKEYQSTRSSEDQQFQENIIKTELKNARRGFNEVEEDSLPKQHPSNIDYDSHHSGYNFNLPVSPKSTYSDEKRQELNVSANDMDYREDRENINVHQDHHTRVVTTKKGTRHVMIHISVKPSPDQQAQDNVTKTELGDSRRKFNENVTTRKQQQQCSDNIDYDSHYLGYNNLNLPGLSQNPTNFNEKRQDTNISTYANGMNPENVENINLHQERQTTKESSSKHSGIPPPDNQSQMNMNKYNESDLHTRFVMSSGKCHLQNSHQPNEITSSISSTIHAQSKQVSSNEENKCLRNYNINSDHSPSLTQPLQNQPYLDETPKDPTVTSHSFEYRNNDYQHRDGQSRMKHEDDDVSSSTQYLDRQATDKHVEGHVCQSMQHHLQKCDQLSSSQLSPEQYKIGNVHSTPDHIPNHISGCSHQASSHQDDTVQEMYTDSEQATYAEVAENYFYGDGDDEQKKTSMLGAGWGIVCKAYKKVFGESNTPPKQIVTEDVLNNFEDILRRFKTLGYGNRKFDKIYAILINCKVLEQEMDLIDNRLNLREFYYFNENLLRNINKLENIDTTTSYTLTKQKKTVIKLIYKIINKAEHKYQQHDIENHKENKNATPRSQQVELSDYNRPSESDRKKSHRQQAQINTVNKISNSQTQQRQRAAASDEFIYTQSTSNSVSSDRNRNSGRRSNNYRSLENINQRKGYTEGNLKQVTSSTGVKEQHTVTGKNITPRIDKPHGSNKHNVHEIPIKTLPPVQVITDEVLNNLIRFLSCSNLTPYVRTGLEEIMNILLNSRELEGKLDGCENVLTEQQFYYLDENLQRNIEKLDGVKSDESSLLTKQKKQAIKYIFKIIDKVDTKSQNKECNATENKQETTVAADSLDAEVIRRIEPSTNNPEINMYSRQANTKPVSKIPCADCEKPKIPIEPSTTNTNNPERNMSSNQEDTEPTSEKPRVDCGRKPKRKKEAMKIKCSDM